jgi:hypothetical protein
MINFKRYNNLLGWLAFLITFIVYTMTVEQSVPLWDCGEFISASYTLQVVHPPGAPLFLMLGRLFSLFALGDAQNIAMAVNMLSVFMSALTVMFSFWIITHFARKIMGVKLQDTSVDSWKGLMIFGAGMVGALAMTFMDTFWFSAVEAEVYASSSMFTMLAIWAILKWEIVKDERGSERWLVFIAYTIGLAIGLHLLNLLVIPAVVLYYFMNRYPVTRPNMIKAGLIGFGSLVFINWGVIPGTVKIGAAMDRLFRNMGLPFHFGLIFTVLLIFGVLAFAVYYTHKNRKPIWNLVFLCMTFIMLGYSSYTMVVIRSISNPPIDMNDPEHAYNLSKYIQREQYGERPLFKGPYYMARESQPSKKEGAMGYRKGETNYEPTTRKFKYKWPERYQTLFPRMGDVTDKANGYAYWYNEKKKGKQTVIPSMGENIKFFVNYQLGWMYMRYFMWNFAGRQSDIQNYNNNIFEGNWMSGVGPIDNARLGTQADMPESLNYNKGRNKYYFLPFLLGLIGIFFQFRKQRNDAWAVVTFFVFTGIAIIVFMNQPPMEPRERDYVSVGSFQIFCIWIGLGVLQLGSWFSKKMNKKLAGVLALSIGMLGAPVLMASQNWDDHDRSGRYLALSFAKNYLNSCEKNAILFTNGDNDTYPLWYVQNVEGYRTDVRVINLSLLPTEWYADALTRQYYDSEALPLSLDIRKKLPEGKRDFIPYTQGKNIKTDEFYPLDKVISFITNDGDQFKVTLSDGQKVNYLPTKNFSIKVDRDAVLKNGVVQAKDAGKIVDKMEFTMRSGNMFKGSLVMFDIIAENAKRGWERPIYFTTTTGDDVYQNMQTYFRHEGLTYRLVPIKSDWNRSGMIDNDLLYDRLMNTFEWGNMEKGAAIYLDDKATLVPRNVRVLFAQTARNYVSERNFERAIKLLDTCQIVIPEDLLTTRPNLRNFIANTYIDAGATEKGKKMMVETIDRLEKELDYYQRLNKSSKKRIKDQAAKQVKATKGYLQELGGLADKIKDEELLNRIQLILGIPTATPDLNEQLEPDPGQIQQIPVDTAIPGNGG